jgi:hypothetical protein
MNGKNMVEHIPLTIIPLTILIPPAAAGGAGEFLLGSGVAHGLLGWSGRGWRMEDGGWSEELLWLSLSRDMRINFMMPTA